MNTLKKSERVVSYMDHTSESYRLTGSQLLSNGAPVVLGSCKHNSGHELFWLSHHVAKSQGQPPTAQSEAQYLHFVF